MTASTAARAAVVSMLLASAAAVSAGPDAGARPRHSIADFGRDPSLLDQALAPDELVSYARDGRELREIATLIYARRGRPFRSAPWRRFAERFPWYHADPKYSDDRLSARDRANLALLTEVARRLQPRASTGPADPAAKVPKSSFPACPQGKPHVQVDEESGTETLYCSKLEHGEEVAHGPEWTWLGTGTLRQVTSVVEGSYDGPTVVWYWTGVRKEEGRYVKGQPEGTWRSYHPNGRLWDESSYVAGKRHGLRRRFFPDGKPALETTYEHGHAVGAWTAYYDNGQRALTAKLPGTSFDGWRMDGKPWPRKERIEPCKQSACETPIEHLEMESLPEVVPKRDCRNAGTVPRDSWPPILRAVRAGWSAGHDYQPGCVGKVTVTCAPDLDGTPGAEALAKIDYRILVNGENDCTTPRLENVWEMSVLVALSPPRAERQPWRVRGIVGFPRFEADNGGVQTSLMGFVRLPNSEAALHVEDDSNWADCGMSDGESILVLREGEWKVVAHKRTQSCQDPEEAEEWDVY